MSQADTLVGKSRELFILAMKRRQSDMEARSYERDLLGTMLTRWEQPDRNPLTSAHIAADLKAYGDEHTHFPRTAIDHVNTVISESFPRHAIAAAAHDMETHAGGLGGRGGSGGGRGGF